MSDIIEHYVTGNNEPVDVKTAVSEFLRKRTVFGGAFYAYNITSALQMDYKIPPEKTREEMNRLVMEGSVRTVKDSSGVLYIPILDKLGN